MKPARVLMPPTVWRAMELPDVHAVVHMEQQACQHPSHAWTADNYRSSLRSGYWCRVCLNTQGRITGVCVSMLGVDEVHLLNIAVARESQGQGLALWMLAQLDELCRIHDRPVIWLEVRPSNQPALALYQSQQYAQVAVRKGYYPAVNGREDALVMKRDVWRVPAQGGQHAAMD